MRVNQGHSRRAVLRAGYGAVIAVLIFSAFEAYRIQLSVSEQSVDIYRHYVEQDQAIATLRRKRVDTAGPTWPAASPRAASVAATAACINMLALQ